MNNGHDDTVTLAGYNGDALEGSVTTRDGREVVTGRGCQDMKSGLAVGMITLLKALDLKSQGKLRGDVILAAVADEEDASLGTAEIIAAGWRANAAIVTEPTDLQLGIAHKGYIWVELTVLGKAAYGSRPEEGVDAIMIMSYLLDGVRVYHENLLTHELLGKASLHCGRIRGGTEESTYPASCTVTVEFRTVPGQTSEQIMADLAHMLYSITKHHQDLQFCAARLVRVQPPYELDMNTDVARLAQEKLLGSGKQQKPVALAFWCDAALLGAVGVPSVVLGPVGGGLHSEHEWVDVNSINETRDRVIGFMEAFRC